MASLTVITGPMFSGKSTQLQREMHRLQSAGLRVLALNHRSDTRYQKRGAFAIVSHDGRSSPARACDEQDLDVIGLRVCDYDAVALDELQFFANGAAFVRACAEVPGVRHVLVAGLNLDFRQEPFPGITALLPHADHVVKLNALCECGREAPWTVLRTGRNNGAGVGGKAQYRATCKACSKFDDCCVHFASTRLVAATKITHITISPRNTNTKSRSSGCTSPTTVSTTSVRLTRLTCCEMLATAWRNISCVTTPRARLGTLMLNIPTLSSSRSAPATDSAVAIKIKSKRRLGMATLPILCMQNWAGMETLDLQRLPFQ